MAAAATPKEQMNALLPDLFRFDDGAVVVNTTDGGAKSCSRICSPSSTARYRHRRR
jgi:hypothetical protein